MVNFEARESGTPEDDWLASERWSRVPALTLEDPRRLVVVSAHPDDETLGAAGLISRVSALGIPVIVVVATNGDASHPDSPTTTPQQLSARRREELLSAVAMLCPDADVRFADLPDGHLDEHEGDLAAVLGSLNIAPGDLVVAPWRSDGHPDHEAAGRIAAQTASRSGAHLLEYPVWMWHWATPDATEVPWSKFVTLRLEPDELVTKAAAMAAHITQNSALSNASGDEMLLTDGFREYFHRPFEIFVTPLGSRTLSRDYFDDFYEGGDDPWGFESRWYEVRKRALTIAALPRPIFSSALEIGCSIGVLTAELAGRCARLIATDIAEQPLSRARRRVIDEAHVELMQADIPNEWHWGEGAFDLIVLSEVGYYWSRHDLARAIERMDHALTADGVMVACHWRHPVDGYPLRGDDVHAALRAHPSFAVLSSVQEEDFLLEVFVRPPARSVARETGLL